MNNLKGKISITRGHNSDDVIIEVYDNASGTEVTKIHLTAQSLGLALTGKGSVDIAYDINPKYAGMRYESMTVNVFPAPHIANSRLTDEQAMELVGPYEVAGWFGHLSDLSNPNKRNRDGSYAVRFGRYVDPVTGQPVSR